MKFLDKLYKIFSKKQKLEFDPDKRWRYLKDGITKVNVDDDE